MFSGAAGIFLIAARIASSQQRADGSNHSEGQLGVAEDRRRETGEFADAQWYRLAQAGLRQRRISLQKIQTRRVAKSAAS
jgi:hypothetical protein